MRFLAALMGLLWGSTLFAAEPSHIRFRLSAHPHTLDWTKAHTSQETYLLMNIMEGLVSLEGTVLKPRLAEKWTVRDNGKTWIFDLRKGVVWSDGVNLIADHFIQSWKRLQDPSIASRSAYLFRDVASYKALSGHQIEIKLKKPLSHFVHALSFWPTFPIRADLIKKSPKSWTDANRLVTLGPYQLTSRNQDTYLLRRNSNYHTPASTLQPTSIEAVVITDEGRAKAEFFEGKLDFILNADTQDLTQASGNANFTARFFNYFATYYLGFNTRDPAFASADLRKAIALALDRSALPGVLQGGQLPAKGWIPPGLDGHGYQMALVASPYEARAALARYKSRTTKPVPRLRIWTEIFDGSSTLQQWVCDRLKSVLEIECEMAPSSSQGRDAHIFIRHWGADFADPINFFEVWTSWSGVTYTGWKNRAYDQLVQRISESFDPSNRLRLMRQAEEFLTDRDMAILPLFYLKNAVLTGANINSFDLSPMNYLFFDTIRTRETIAP